MNTSFDTIYATDDKLVNEGAPMSIGYNANGKEMILYIAQERNENHIKSIRSREKVMEQMRHDEDGLYKIRCAVIAESILTKWINILDTKGNDHPDTFENKVAALEKYKHLMQDIIIFCGDRSNYKPKGAQVEEEIDTKGNL